MEDLSDLVYDEDDADKPLLVKEARELAKDELRVGDTYFTTKVRPILDRKPILPGGSALRIRKGDVMTLCNILLRVGPDRAEEIVESNDLF